MDASSSQSGILVSTRDLAAKLGLSHNTVARALRNHPHVAAATRQRVLEAARAAGWRANPLVTALMTQVSRRKRVKPSGEVIAYLTSYGTEDEWRAHHSLAAAFEGAQERAAVFGFQVQPFWLGPQGRDSLRMSRMMRARGIRGVLLAPGTADRLPLSLAWDDQVIIVLGPGFNQVPLHRVTHHQTTGIYLCYHQLRQAGYRRIGLLLHCDDDRRTNHFWRAGFLAAQQVYGGRRVSPLFVESWDDRASILSWLDRTRADAVISLPWALPHLLEEGLKPSANLGYACLDIAPQQKGQVAGIWQDNYRLGAVAVDSLMMHLFRNETGLPSIPTVTMVEGTWLDGPITPVTHELIC